MTRRTNRFALCLVLVVAAGCSGGLHTARQKEASKLATPGTFTGTLPCADCEGIRYHLDLWSDHAFHLEREWLGHEHTQYDIGRWSLDSARKVLILETAGTMVAQFEAAHPKALRLLDPQGHHIQSALNYTINSNGRLEAADVTLPLRGELVRDGAALRFRECLTGRTYIASDEGEATAARQAMIASEDTDSVYVTMEATLHGNNVVVRRFINAWPGESCERSLSDATLVNTFWRLDRINHELVHPPQSGREPHILLHDDGKGATYAATAGCNQMAGSYALSSESLTFSPGPATLMGCPPEQDAMEKRLIEVLSRTRGYHVIGNTLELMDETGASLALFEAVYFRS
jgi:copper homeostasis protein (lipoprotein)